VEAGTLYAYIETAVKRYDDTHPALESFQLENEALAWWFGDCRENPDAERIKEEFDLSSLGQTNQYG
jgi:hypothetical protein